MALDVGAAKPAGRTTIGGVLVVCTVVIIRQLVIDRVGFQLFVAIRQVPSVFGAGFAEGDTCPKGLIVIVARNRVDVVDVFSGHLDGEGTGIQRE